MAGASPPPAGCLMALMASAESVSAATRRNSCSTRISCGVMPLINMWRILTDNPEGSAAQRQPDRRALPQTQVLRRGAGDADADRPRDEVDDAVALGHRRDLRLDDVPRRDRRRPLAEKDDLLAADPDDERERGVADDVVRQHELEALGPGDARSPPRTRCRPRPRRWSPARRAARRGRRSRRR